MVMAVQMRPVITIVREVRAAAATLAGTGAAEPAGFGACSCARSGSSGRVVSITYRVEVLVERGTHRSEVSTPVGHRPDAWEQQRLPAQEPHSQLRGTESAGKPVGGNEIESCDNRSWKVMRLRRRTASTECAEPTGP